MEKNAMASIFIVQKQPKENCFLRVFIDFWVIISKIKNKIALAFKKGNFFLKAIVSLCMLSQILTHCTLMLLCAKDLESNDVFVYATLDTYTLYIIAFMCQRWKKAMVSLCMLSQILTHCRPFVFMCKRWEKQLCLCV